jgi:hypothetical protein
MFEPYVILLGLILIPAMVIFGGFTYLRLKRAKFHRQRITKGSTARH